MKHLYLIIALTLITAKSFSQNYFITTAQKSGNWSLDKNWSIEERTDGRKINTVIIPKNITIKLDVDSDLSDYGDVELEIVGELQIRAGRKLFLSNSSKIAVKDGGTINTDEAARKNKEKKNNNKNEQISIGNVVKFDAEIDGEIFATSYANSLTGTSPMGFSSNAMLPVTFVSFSVKEVNKDLIDLTWTTTDEVNNSHFEIQRSVDGKDFKTVALVLPAIDNSNMQQYKYSDRYAAKGTVYYRIRQVDLDGKDKFSAVRTFGGAQLALDAQIYVSGKNTVTINLTAEASNITVRLVSINGVVMSQRSNVSEERISLTAYNAAPGTYVVQVSDKKGMFTSKKVMF